MLWDAVVAPEMTFRLVPEVLDAVDVVAVLGEELGVIDADVVEVRDIEYVVSLEAVCVDNAVGFDLAFNDGRFRAGIWDDRRRLCRPA